MNQRRNLIGEGDREESVEEKGLLRDVEQCTKSAEEFRRFAAIEKHGENLGPVRLIQDESDQVPTGEAAPQFKNGSYRSSSPSNSKTNDDASDASEVESDGYGPDHDVGFSAEVYLAMIAALLGELRQNMANRKYHDAEQICKTIMKHSKDRHISLGIPFDSRAEVEMALAEIYLEQNRYQKTKRVVRQLLQDGSMDADHRSKLHLFLARAYYGRDQWSKAEFCARMSLRAREKQHGQEHRLTLESATLLINIYERQGEAVTANVLRRVYWPDTRPSLPPKSALRAIPRRRPPSPRSLPQIPDSLQEQIPPGSQEADHAQGKNHVRWAPELCVNESSINTPFNEQGQTPLISAIHQGDETYVKLNLSRKADINQPCADGISPLMHAVTLGHASLVELLLQRNANVDIRTSGWTPLHKATDAGDLGIMKLLLAFGADIEAQTPLEHLPPPFSSSAGSRAVANDGPDPNPNNDELDERDHRWTPLLRAASRGHEPTVRLLLDHKANIEAPSPISATPLMYACANLHPATVDLLSIRGASVHATDDHGWTPLHHTLTLPLSSPSTEQKALHIVPLLLAHEADINARCHLGKTALHHAVEKNARDTVSFLLAHGGADVEARDRAELTPLHTAIGCRLAGMVALLLAHGADSAAMDASGEDALAAARRAQRKSPEVIALLVKEKKRLKREMSDAAKGRGRGSGSGRKGALLAGRRGDSGAGDAGARYGAGDVTVAETGRRRWFGSRMRKGED